MLVDPTKFVVRGVTVTRLSVCDTLVTVDLYDPDRPTESYNYTYRMLKPPKELDYQGSFYYGNPKVEQ